MANGSSEEDNVGQSSDSGNSEEGLVRSGSFNLEAKGSCCNAGRVYHACYVLMFFAYVVIFPLWAKWIITAPMPHLYWHEELEPFPLLPLRKTNIAMRGAESLAADSGSPEITMSPVPQDRFACNYSCSTTLLGHRTSLMNFDVELMLNDSYLTRVGSQTTYPVLLTSEDFEHWQLVADRSDAYPQPFFLSHSDATANIFSHTTDRCMSYEAAHGNFTSKATYIVGCIAWRPSSQQALRNADSLTKEDVGRYCDSVGGVCGWPCGSTIPSSRLPGCSINGHIDAAQLADHIPGQRLDGRVEVFACRDTTSPGCALSTGNMPDWPCHKCQRELDDDGGEGSGDFEDPDSGLWQRRRLQGLAGEDDVISQRYHSLPRLQVKLYDPMVPMGADISSTPHAFVLASHSLDGPFTRLYTDGDMVNTPVGMDVPETKVSRDKENLYAMDLERRNSLRLRSESCFGKRGPLYVVACAVNQSIYDDVSLWNHHKTEFSHGQEVAPPPFNDRCLAVAGRCGYACTTDTTGAGILPYCTADGYIEQHYLVNDRVDLVYNQCPSVLAFIIVLLCGFAVRSLTLCPGIFSPYPHAHDYDPEMTDSFKYIVVVSPVAGADENKGTMIRNIVGTVSCMPPDCRCRYHVVVNDEGHRNEMKSCWQIFCNIIVAIPMFGGDSYEDNVREFMGMWCSETKIMTLSQIGGKVKALDDKIIDRLCGKSTLKKLLAETRWGTWDRGYLGSLEAAIEAMAEDLRNNYNKFTQSIPYLDNIGDWEPKDPGSLALRMHYTSRAKPIEDSRNLMVQHVAVGVWYYKVPRGATTEDWLYLRTKPKEMVYAIANTDEDTYNVPLRSSHGKAGGLNFVDNYLSVYSRRPQNVYGDVRDESPCLYAIADARHQFQPDFMLSCIPRFFTVAGDLDERVAFTQAPQHYPEYQDKSDYMDYNNAQFFRLNAMIRNCCGGVSSCGTNGMWLIPHRDDDFIWEKRRKRVRDRDNKKRDELIEREQFHTSCKIEDTASSLDQVLAGRHSQFVNRKLSFGMAKAPTDFIGAQQRWVEGAVTLALQWFSNNADAHGLAKRNGWMLWATVIGFTAFIIALIRLVTREGDTSVFVEYGVVGREDFNQIANPVKNAVYGSLNSVPQFMKLLGQNSINTEVYLRLFDSFVIWALTTLCAFLVVWFVTTFAKCCRGGTFPNEMRWWGRLLISMDNLTYFMWFWTSFFWIGFNYYTAVTKSHYHFNNLGMMCFMLVINILNWGLTFSNSARYSVMESIDANEVAALSMDNIWRSNQLFFMTGPIQLFSLVRGIGEFIKYKFYGQDIGGWSGGDLGKISVDIVKYWTTLMLLGCVAVWICYYVYAHEYDNSWSACIVVTLISLDVLHPCTFLWLGNVSLGKEELNHMSWLTCLTTLKWWQVQIKHLILNDTFTGLLKYVGPVYFIILPFMALTSSYFGVSGAYLLVAMGPGH